MMEHIHFGDAHVLVLYDGVCALCNRLVRFLLKHDRKDVFRFAPLQSLLAERVLARHQLAPQALDTVYLVERYEQADEKVEYIHRNPLKQGLGRVAATMAPEQ